LSPSAPTQPEAPPPVDKSRDRVRSMFATIARKYDFLNHLLSLNIDRRWRALTVRKVRPRAGDALLDCCTGTADLALAYRKAFRHGDVEVVGSDFCREMLAIGWKKARKRGLDDRLALIEADTLRLPFSDDRFGVVTVAFGLRNVANTTGGLDEMIRVTKPGGQVAVLEFSRPRGPILGRLYLFFFQRLLPKIGQTIAPNRYDAYKYLPETVLQFPDGQAMLDLMGSRGLTDLASHPLTFGIATLYIGRKPGGSDD